MRREKSVDTLIKQIEFLEEKNKNLSLEVERARESEKRIKEIAEEAIEKTRIREEELAKKEATLNELIKEIKLSLAEAKGVKARLKKEIK